VTVPFANTNFALGALEKIMDIRVRKPLTVGQPCLHMPGKKLSGTSPILKHEGYGATRGTHRKAGQTKQPGANALLRAVLNVLCV
jgi:hypothetical protein